MDDRFGDGKRVFTDRRSDKCTWMMALVVGRVCLQYVDAKA